MVPLEFVRNLVLCMIELGAAHAAARTVNPAGEVELNDHANAVAAIADRLFEAEISGVAVAPVAGEAGAGQVDMAYAIQAHNTKRALDSGRRLVGRKIGLTSPAVQTQLGVDQPDFGMLFADNVIGTGGDAPWRRFIQPRVEAEIAFVFERDLDVPDCTPSELVSAIAYCLPAVEIVDSRITDWKISIVDTIADNASSGMFVLGSAPVRLADVDLRLCGMVLERNGAPVSFGVGAACLGHPLNATLWLARKVAALGYPLRAGDVVLSGALGPMIPAASGDRIVADIGGVGSVRFGFSP